VIDKQLQINQIVEFPCCSVF